MFTYKKFKRRFYDNNKAPYTEVLRVNLNTRGEFEFDLPYHYRDLFNEKGIPDIFNCKIDSMGTVNINTMDKLTHAIYHINKHFLKYI